MKAVDKLIFNALVMHRRIYLPQVGVLAVERIKAREKDGNRVAAPFFRVRFSREGASEAASIVEMIGRTGGADNAQAEEIYRNWLEHARSGEDVAIDGVGVIRGGVFVPEKTFAEMLNPFSAGEVKIRPVKRRYGLTVLSVVLLGAVIAFGWYMLCGPDGRDLRCLPASRIITERETEVFRRDVTATAENDRAAETSEEYIASQLALQAAGETSGEASRNGTQPDAAEADRSGVTENGPGQTAGRNNPEAAAGRDKAQPSARAAYYVAAGVFSNEGNADRFIASAPVRSPRSLQYYKMPFKGDKVLVGVCPSTTREEAEACRQELLPDNPGLWIYRNR